MTSKDILYNKKVLYYKLKTETLKTENKKVTTHYYVIWYFTDGSEEMEITKEEYAILFKELENDNE